MGGGSLSFRTCLRFGCRCRLWRSCLGRRRGGRCGRFIGSFQSFLSISGATCNCSTIRILAPSWCPHHEERCSCSYRVGLLWCWSCLLPPTSPCSWRQQFIVPWMDIIIGVNDGGRSRHKIIFGKPIKWYNQLRSILKNGEKGDGVLCGWWGCKGIADECGAVYYY